jgi:tetratricopeptide (TPR) repeat protein
MDIEKLYDTGYQAFERGNYEYAIEMFKRIIFVTPEHVKARKSLRATERKLVGQPKKGLGGINFKLMFATIGNMKKKANRLIETCEEILVKDPWNKQALTVLGQAALAGGFPETAVLTFEDLASMDREGKDIKVLKFLGRAYKLKEDYENAIKTFQKLQRIKPNDNEARDEMRDLGAKQSLKLRQDKEKFTSLVRDEQTAKDLASGERMIRTDAEMASAIRTTQEQLSRNPKEPKLLMKLGDLHRQNFNSAEAKRYYQMIMELDPNNMSAQAKIGDADIAEMEKKVEAAKMRHAQEGTSASKGEYDKLRKEKMLYQVHEFERRVKAQPTDMILRYSLGMLYFEAGLYDKAVASFQRAKNDPKIKSRVQIILGRTLIKMGQNDLAISVLGELIEGKIMMDEEKKNALYYRAEAYKNMRKNMEARKDLETIYLEDIGFRDVAKKIKELDDLMSGTAEGPVQKEQVEREWTAKVAELEKWFDVEFSAHKPPGLAQEIDRLKVRLDELSPTKQYEMGDHIRKIRDSLEEPADVGTGRWVELHEMCDALDNIIHRYAPYFRR